MPARVNEILTHLRVLDFGNNFSISIIMPEINARKASYDQQFDANRRGIPISKTARPIYDISFPWILSTWSSLDAKPNHA